MSIFEKLFHKNDVRENNVEAKTVNWSAKEDPTSTENTTEDVDENELFYKMYEMVTEETLSEEEKARIKRFREQSHKPKTPAPGEPGSSEDNPLVVGMTGPDIAKFVVFKDGIWYQTDGLGNGVIR